MFAELPYTKASLLHSLYEREVRVILMKMKEAAGQAFISPQHDGLGEKKVLTRRWPRPLQAST